jgi:hypothetical protein
MEHNSLGAAQQIRFTASHVLPRIWFVRSTCRNNKDLSRDTRCNISGWEAQKNIPTVREIALGVARQRIPRGVMADVIDELCREQPGPMSGLVKRPRGPAERVRCTSAGGKRRGRTYQRCGRSRSG